METPANEAAIAGLCAENIALRQRASALEDALRQWLKTCECHGTGTITRIVGVYQQPPQTTTRQCHADYCKQSRAALLRAVKGG